jgi:hypothetical protein
MDRQQAFDRVTQQPTPAGKAITTDETFALFAALVPDSPWSTRLLKIRDIFNDLATAAVMLTETNAHEKFEALAAEDPEAANDPEVKRFMQAIDMMTAAMANMKATVDTGTAPPVDVIPSPAPAARPILFNPANLPTVAAQVGGMRYESAIPNVGTIKGWSFKDDQLEQFAWRIMHGGAANPFNAVMTP